VWSPRGAPGPVSGAGCGPNHTFVWTSEGEVAGRRHNHHCLRRVSLRLIKLALGLIFMSHYPWLRQRPGAYSFGWGSYGQLGHGDTGHRLSPTVITALRGKARGPSAATPSTDRE